MAKVLSQKGFCLYLHKLACWKGAHGGKDLPQFTGKGGFAGAGVSGKQEMVPDEHVCRESPVPVVLHGLDNGADMILDALKAHITVKFGKDFIFASWDKALFGIHVRGRNRFASADCRLHREGLGNFFGQMTVVVAKVRLAHEPCEMALEGTGEVFGGRHAVLFTYKFKGEAGEFLYAEGVQLEVELKQAVDVRIVPKEVLHVVENAAENHYGRAFRGAHAGK